MRDIIEILKDQQCLTKDVLIRIANILQKNNIQIDNLDIAIASTDREVITDNINKTIKKIQQLEGVMQKEGILSVFDKVKQIVVENYLQYLLKSHKDEKYQEIKNLLTLDKKFDAVPVNFRWISPQQFSSIATTVYLKEELDNLKDFMRKNNILQKDVSFLYASTISDELKKFASDLVLNNCDDEAVQLSYIIANYFTEKDQVF